jgi:hypothetical protein
MVKRCGLNILPKLAKLGFDVQSSSDVALVPDAVFEPGCPKGALLRRLLDEYKTKKADQAAASRAAAGSRAAASRQFEATSLSIESLLSKPFQK